ncbi:RNA polymerase III-inhibiting protein maf1 [Friedmanniomyces endolithicus]|nr:RNA polymerase III-inhibiting protein maf1 [Friedmanniomyces endolithicus]KAK0770078.1 RNA polymerase III-inhibiting protein maf1 [Friedmanniomyces endolithicus]KAK0823410.1 RNA polymerase III-inhibiting protein maf1 [Friedmanniomyces endolithicus]KAK0886676.1 RNA polymerase III-inhibiting protein maf1 [Friedmanniomyces endolithicus]KAK1022324.1 RNA polymerase III-inhibiting protein maf1 [Friedmanniomyces endolithicus]
MDKYYGNVCELDIIFNFQKAYFILDELLLAGELQESSKKNVLRVIGAQDSLEDMEYLPLRDFDSVTNALNFSTPDCHVIGGCDLYTTKAAGGDKKLYRNIEHSLESQYESLVRLSASLSPPYISASSDSGADPDKDANSGGHHKRKSSRRVETPEIDLSRASPFGPLSQITARRTFAYLIATLNASHPDYDFSHLLRASDFHKERSLRSIMTTVDSTLQNLRPKPSLLYLAPPVLSRSAPVVANSMGSEVWSPRMWTLIDAEMGLRQCEKYSFVPEEDPFDGEDGGASVWSMHYFFFNKERKRVCYLHLRGLSVISHSPVHAPMSLGVRRREGKGGSVSVGEGAGKRASYWLGSLVGVDEIDTSGYGEDDDDEEGMVGMAGTYDVEDGEEEAEEEVPDMSLDDIRSELAEGNYGYDAEDDEMEDTWLPQGVRGVSEEIGEVMDL